MVVIKHLLLCSRTVTTLQSEMSFRVGQMTPSKRGNLSNFLLVIKMFPTPVLKSFWNYWCHMLLYPIASKLIQALGMLDKSSTP